MVFAWFHDLFSVSNFIFDYIFYTFFNLFLKFWCFFWSLSVPLKCCWYPWWYSGELIARVPKWWKESLRISSVITIITYLLLHTLVWILLSMIHTSFMLLRLESDVLALTWKETRQRLSALNFFQTPFLLANFTLFSSSLEWCICWLLILLMATFLVWE